MFIYEETNNSVSGAFLKCFSIFVALKYIVYFKYFCADS